MRKKLAIWSDRKILHSSRIVDISFRTWHFIPAFILLILAVITTIPAIIVYGLTVREKDKL